MTRLPPSERVARGRRAETAAAQYLEAHGLTILDRNVYVGGAEIDLIVADGDEVAFVEVRARRRSRFGTPEASVSATKRTHLTAAAAAWLAARPQPWPRCRFDVVAVAGDEGDEELRWHRAAFEAQG